MYIQQDYEAYEDYEAVEVLGFKLIMIWSIFKPRFVVRITHD
jgi:hypothetical protein